MAHPLTSKRIYFLSYILIWLILAVIQMSILIYFFEIDLLLAATDALVVNLIHSIIGLALWYPVRFNPLTAKNIFGPLVNIIGTGIFAVGAWVGLSYLLLNSIFTGNENYILFLQNSIPNRIITDVLLFALLVLVYSLIVYSTNLKEKVDAEQNLKNLVREAELNMLKTQINPHFLFNSLNSISHLIKKDPDKARGMIIKLSEFLRYSLKFGDEENISLSEEIENIDRYLEIEKIRFGDKIIYTTEIDPLALNCTVPNMILQPLLENAIKHGVYESIKPVYINLKISKNLKQLQFHLSNNYEQDGVRTRGAGIGLKNISERLRILYGRIDLLDYSELNGVFNVYFRIPQN